jgi:large subunit ribosomal protein L14e
MLDVGRLCLKTAGREAGKYCIIVKKIDDTFVTVSGPRLVTGVKRRRCNIAHLEPLQHKIKIQADASDEQILQLYEKEGIFTQLKMKKPSAEDLAEEKERKKAPPQEKAAPKPEKTTPKEKKHHKKEQKPKEAKKQEQKKSERKEKHQEKK